MPCLCRIIGTRMPDIENMFISTNFEEDGCDENEADANDDNELVRWVSLKPVHFLQPATHDVHPTAF